MKIYKEGNFYHYDSTAYVGLVHESALGITDVLGGASVRFSLDLVGRRGEADVQEVFLYADIKNLAGTAHGVNFLAIVTAILT